MDNLWPVLSWILAIVLIVAGLVGTMLPIIPGAPLVFFGLWLIALTDHYQHVGWPTLSLLAAVVMVTVAVDFVARSEGSRVGTGGGSTCSSGWSPYHYIKIKTK